MTTSVEDVSHHRWLAIGKPTRRTWVGIVVVVALALVATGAFWLAGRSSTGDVEKFLNSYEAAWEAGDGAAVLDHFAPDGVVVPRFGGELKGAAIAGFVELAGPGERAIELIGDPIIVETAGNGVNANRRYLVSQHERFTVGGRTYEGVGMLWLVEQSGRLLIEKHQDISSSQP